MINTYYGLDQLVLSPSGKTFFAALVIGFLFGFVLERAGFGSSKRLAGVFYFKDMTVLKVMFTALITAMLGLSIVVSMGWLDLETQVALIPTLYGVQAIGGLIFGVGFVVSGWCPGTAAVGMASGKIDALVFLVGTIFGSIVFNETYALTEPIRAIDPNPETLVAFGMSPMVFGFLFTLAAIGAFYFAEWVERRAGGSGKYLHSEFLKRFSLILGFVALLLIVLPEGWLAPSGSAAVSDQTLLESIDAAEDHIEPMELADRIMAGEANLLVVDIRSPQEYAALHIKGAVNVELPDLLSFLEPQKNLGTVVLYSNGMTHPAQARDILERRGYRNTYMLSDGLQGFIDQCLKPVSLRYEPLTPEEAARVNAWRGYFLGKN